MTALKRSLGLTHCILMGVGVILGAGIYALVGKAAALGGNAVWISFSLAAALAALTGLSYAELSSFIPKAGGEYYYVRRAFGPCAAFMVTWLLLISLAVASGAVALGFGGYAAALIGGNEAGLAVALVVLSAVTLFYGINQTAWVAATCTILEIIGLLVIMWVGLPDWGQVDYFEMPHGLGGTLSAAALIFFAYIGFEEIVQLSEETKAPTHTIPRAILWSIAITTLLYVLVAVAAISVLGWQKLGQSTSPLADVAKATLGSKGFVVLSFIALFSTGNTVLILLLAASRLAYGMAEDGTLPRILADIHPQRQSPHLATFTTAAIAAVMIVALKRIEVIANVVNFGFFVTFIVINASVIALRYKEPDVPRVFRMPVNYGRVPVLAVVGIVSALVMMLNIGMTALLLGVGLAAIGALLFGYRWLND